MTTKAVNLARVMTQEIEDGRYPVGGRIPTEAELQQRFDVSRHTVREALRQLKSRGLVSARAGIGWVGKNTLVIHPRLGSWLLLGEVLTTIELPQDEPITDHCGTCTRCIEACPTGAITEPYKLDARRCISYLTIEHAGGIPDEFHEPIGEWLYGCDICQDVCPHNQRVEPATDPALQPRFPTGTLNVAEVLWWGGEEYSLNLRRSAMKRVKLPVLQRNAAIVEQNLQLKDAP